MSKGILRPIIPRKPLYDTKVFEREIRNGLVDLDKIIKNTMLGTVENWKTKVLFESDFRKNGSTMTLDIYTTNEIYMYVNDGTDPHIIVPRRAPYLRFQSGFMPKTWPNSLRSGSGRHFGPMVSTRLVHHPGTKARNFTKMIALKHSRDLMDIIQQAIEKAARER